MPRFRCGEFWGHSPNLNLLNDPALNRSADLAVPNRRCGVSSRLPATPLVPLNVNGGPFVSFCVLLVPIGSGNL
jgi:hypothetical protein